MLWLAVGAAVAAASSPAIAQPWEFNAAADIGIIYTDNLFVDPVDETSDVIYAVIPSVSLSTEGERVSGRFLYRPEAYFYSDNNEFDDIVDVLDANFTFAVVPEAFSVFASAVNFQSIKSPEGDFPNSNIIVTDNRVDARVFEVRPIWDQRFGEVRAFASVRAIRSEFDDEVLQEQDALSSTFRLDNYAAQQGVSWQLSFRDESVEYENDIEFSYQQASASVGYWVGSGLRVFVVGGLETPLGRFDAAGLEDDFYEIGFESRPNRRLDLVVAVGKRTFGDSARLRATYRLKRGTTTLTYSQEPATRAGLLFDRRPIQDLDNLDRFGDQAGVDDRFIQKRGQWTTSLELARTQLQFRVFDERRDSRVGADGAILENEVLSGAAVRLGRQLGRKLEIGASVDAVRREEGERDNEFLQLSLDAGYALSARSSVSLELARRTQDNVADAGGDDSVEHQIRLFFRFSLK
ncbi:MAG: TIGR03016 family PEP-CTERM system-associated outer membrane protein [Pseudomonadota bacterium]